MEAPDNARIKDVGTDRPDSESSVLLLDGSQWSYLSKRYELTHREVQIAALICQGLRQSSIARQLDIRPGTVKTHIRNIYRKVKVKNKISMLLRFVGDSRVASGGCDHS